MLRKLCPICESQTTCSVAVLEDLPVFCNVQYASRQEAVDQPRGMIELHYCSNCQHFFNAAFDTELMRYGQAYENSLHFSPIFKGFAQDLAQDLVDRLGVRDSQVIDIGCGKGDFLKLICAIGNNEGHGFDPSYDPERDDNPMRSNVHLHSEPFSAKAGEALNPRLLTCRHVLEHVEEPGQFLGQVAHSFDTSRNLAIYLEVPNALFTFRDLGIWDIIYEHCQYFTARSLAELAQRVGVSTERVSESFGGQYLSLEARLKPGTVAKPGFAAHSDHSRWASSFSKRFNDVLATWRSRLDRLMDEGPAVVWGAGSKGVTFVNLLQANETVVALVDVNPHKQGQYVAGTGHQIISPEDLDKFSLGSVLVMNPQYVPEIREHIRELNIDVELFAVS